MSRYQAMTTADLVRLEAIVTARLSSLTYVPCDNESDEGCCDDCGLANLRDEISARAFYARTDRPVQSWRADPWARDPDRTTRRETYI